MKKELLYTTYIILLFILIYSCARISSPTGGIKDEYPPTILKYSIENESRNVAINTKEIKIEFDEYIALKDAINQIIVSPPMETTPTFSPLGSPRKYITVKFNEPLKENTTYSINFGESIEDYNEGNKLSNFVYVFSTGEVLDSLTYSGKIHDVKSLEFDEKALVGLYKIDTAFNDSTLFKQKPYYVTRPDSLGNFQFKYLHEGRYFLMGISDGNRNLKYDPIIDKLAFKKEPISLPTEEKSHLKLFTEQSPFAVKSPSFKDWGKIIFEFLGNPNHIHVENQDKSYTKELQLASQTRDSLIYWFKPLAKDTLKESKKDTLHFFVYHNKQPVDTITFRKKIHFRPKKLSLNLKPSEHDFGTMKFTSETPLVHFDKNLISVLKDSTRIPFKVFHEEKNPYTFQLDFKKKFEENYTVTFLPNAILDFFGETTDTLTHSLQTLKEQDYANLEVTLKNKPSSHFWLQLMQNKKVKREQYTQDSIVQFNHIKPGTYTLQIIVDENNNKLWDTGHFFKKTQPESYLFNQEKILLNAYWDVKKTWNIPQKPSIKKNAESQKNPKS
ncbi:MAG: Ig-like domain-containing protein [Flavobacteriales bacterium]